MIYVGYPQKAPAGLKSPSYLPPEGYLLKTIGKTLYLFGDDKLLSKKWNIHRDGTFASVQYLLDEYFGCRFFMAGKNGEFYPPNKNIVIPQLSVQKSPGMPNRGLRCNRKDEDGRLFCRRHRLGRAFVYEGSHAFEHWYNRFGKNHPDVFALQLDGTQIPPYAHPQARHNKRAHFLFADGHVEALSPVPLKGKRNMFTNGRVQSFYSYFVGTLRV